MPVRRLEGLPRAPRRPAVPHTLQLLRDAKGFLNRMRVRHGPNFAHGYFGFEAFVVGEPELVREVLLDREQAFSSRMGWDYTIGELFEGGLMLRDFDDHRAQRNIMQAAFRPAAMRGYFEIINPFVAKAVARWSDDPRLRLYPEVKRLGLRLAAELLLGISFDEREGRAVGRAFVDAVQASVAPIRRPVPLTSYWRGMRGRAFLIDYFSKEIPTRRIGDGRDMFTQLCQAVDEDGEQLTDEEIAQHVIFLVLAAHDTTASAITTAVAALAESPECQERTRREIESISGSDLDYGELSTLAHTEWVIKESLRMQPPVGFVVRRAVRDCKLGPYGLPKNAVVTPSAWVTHYLPGWWTDPERFDPNRFSPERSEHKGHPGLYYPFGGGAHMCLGVHLAGMQAKTFLYHFLRHYRFTLRRRRPVKFVSVPIPHPRGGLSLRLTPVGKTSV